MRKKGMVLCALILVGLVALCCPVFADQGATDTTRLVAQHSEDEPGMSGTTEKEKEDGVGAKGWLVVFSAIAAAVGIGIATIGPGLAQGNAVSKAMEAIGRNPESQSKILPTLLIGLAFMESLVLYALLISLALLFFNPLVPFVK